MTKNEYCVYKSELTGQEFENYVDMFVHVWSKHYYDINFQEINISDDPCRGELQDILRSTWYVVNMGEYPAPPKGMAPELDCFPRGRGIWCKVFVPTDDCVGGEKAYTWVNMEYRIATKRWYI